MSDQNLLGYVVVTFNQASHQPELDYADLHTNVDDAVAERDAKAAETAQIHRRERHVVAMVLEMDDDDIRSTRIAEELQEKRWRERRQQLEASRGQ